MLFDAKNILESLVDAEITLHTPKYVQKHNANSFYGKF